MLIHTVVSKTQQMDSYGDLSALAQIVKISRSKEQVDRIIGKHNADKLPLVRSWRIYKELPDALDVQATPPV